MVWLISPANDTIIQGGTPIVMGILDSTGIQSATWNIGSGATALPASYVIDSTGWSDGYVSIMISVENNAGIWTNASYRFSVDSTPPSLALSSPANGSEVHQGTPIVVLASDANLVTVVWVESGRTLSPPYVLDTLGLPDGPMDVTLVATDPAGNSRTATYHFTLRALAPAPAPAPDGASGGGPGPSGPASGSSLAVDAGISVTVVVLLALAVGASSRASEGFAAVMLMPLFTRLRRDQVRNQVSRGRIIQFISDHPGASFGQVRRGVELSGGACAYHLRVLERSGEIQRVASGATVRFYRPGLKRDREALPPLSYVARRVLESVLELERPTLRDVSLALAARGEPVSDKNLGYHLRVLAREKGLLETARRGRKTLYFVDEAQRVQVGQRLSSEAKVDTALETVAANASRERTQDESEVARSDEVADAAPGERREAGSGGAASPDL